MYMNEYNISNTFKTTCMVTRCLTSILKIKLSQSNATTCIISAKLWPKTVIIRIHKTVNFGIAMPTFVFERGVSSEYLTGKRLRGQTQRFESETSAQVGSHQPRKKHDRPFTIWPPRDKS